MKILHTADIHLKQSNDERWDTLALIVELGTREKIDALLISGDLFDRDIEAEKLKVNIRELFSERSYRIFLLPGNHDSNSFGIGSYYGENAEVIHSVDHTYEIGDTRIVGIPFSELKQTDLFSILNRISERLDSNKYNILMYHGELLDSFFSRRDFGDEGEKRYMPVRLDYFREMNFDYIVAGHFHTNFNVWAFDNKRYFIYPGSPVSITRREIGKRCINLFNVGDAPKSFFLNTPFYVDLNIKLDPFDEIDPVATINQELSKIENSARINLIIDGFINSQQHHIDEKLLKSKIEEIQNEKENIIKIELKFRDLSTLLEDDIFKSFNNKLISKMIDSSKIRDIREFFMRAMMEAGV